MPDETENRLARTVKRSGHLGGSSGDESPLQARAAFIKDWDWQSIISINRGTCERGRAQHGINSETACACAQKWEAHRGQVGSLAETNDFLKECHKQAPFLFFNGLACLPEALIRMPPKPTGYSTRPSAQT
ncbi:MAG: hypothetical protein WCO56_06375 [Verrucomicrobiota bacterium]